MESHNGPFVACKTSLPREQETISGFVDLFNAHFLFTLLLVSIDAQESWFVLSIRHLFPNRVNRLQTRRPLILNYEI